MTTQELIKIIDEKIKDARIDYDNTYNEYIKCSQPERWQGYGLDMEHLNGELEAYTDIKILLKNEVLEEQISNTPIQTEPIGYSTEKDTVGKNR